MTAYIIVGLSPKDEEKIQQYGAQVPPTLAKYKGEIIIKGAVEQLHGHFDYKAQVILAFPTRDAAYNWYHSEDYQALISTRNQGMDSQFQLIG